MTVNPLMWLCNPYEVTLIYYSGIFISTIPLCHLNHTISFKNWFARCLGHVGLCQLCTKQCTPLMKAYVADFIWSITLLAYRLGQHTHTHARLEDIRSLISDRRRVHLTIILNASVYSENISSTAALCSFIDLQPCAHRPARMEVPVQLQIPAVVSVDGLDCHVEKVWTDLHNYISSLLLDYITLQCVYVRALG